MDFHTPSPQKWNIIFLIYAELADLATQNGNPGDYGTDVKADLDELKTTILQIEVAAHFNIFTIENIVEIENNLITSDYTYIQQLIFDPEKKKNRQKCLKTSTNENFDQKEKDIQRVFEYIDQSYPAERNLLITWDHGSAFGIFKKTLSDRPPIPPVTTPAQPIITSEASSINQHPSRTDQNPILKSSDDKFQILNKRGVGDNDIITFVRNNRFERPDSFFLQPISLTEEKTNVLEKFALLSNDTLARAIKNGFKNEYVDVLIMFNCDMQNMHTCYSFRDTAKYLVAPEGDMSAPGYDYIAIANLIRNSKDRIVSGEEIAALAINTFKQNYINRSRGGAFNQIAVFAFCLVNYEDKVIQTMRHFISTLENMIERGDALAGNLKRVRIHSYAFGVGKDMDYFLMDLNNYLQVFVELFGSQLKDLKNTLQLACDSITIASAIGDNVYPDLGDPLQATHNCKPTGLTIYFPPKLEDATTTTMGQFMVPNAPFSTSLIKAIEWMEFLNKLYNG